MTTAEIINACLTAAIVVATVVGPIAAVQVQKYLERRSEAKRRKEWVFYTLMSLRASRLNHEFVRALNTIDFAFHADKPKQVESEREVIRKWRDYLAHVAKPPADGNWVPWNQRIDDLVVDLLQAMADDLGYPFDRQNIRSGGYATQASADHEIEMAQIRRHLLSVLDGKRPFPVMNTYVKDGKLHTVKLPGME